MAINEKINKIFEIKEAYELPSKLASILLDEEKAEGIFKQFLEIEPNLNYDWFTDYFQNEQADRKNLKQDYTPNCICKILSGINKKQRTAIGDICSGSGGLTISQWEHNKDSIYYFEEISTRVLPLLLFNLAIRGINGIVKSGDSLKNEFNKIYELECKSNGFSSVKEIGAETSGETKVDFIVSNPPYSLSWNNKGYEEDERFKGFGIAPSNKADYAFVLHSINKLKEDGEAFFILPHGVLFRGGKEKEIRERLIEQNLIDCIIGLPNKLFLNTDIPVFILGIKKNRKVKDVLIIDASKDFKKGTKQNDMLPEHIDRITKTHQERKEIDRYSSVVSRYLIEENDYNLNIPRYVDTFEPEEPVDIVATTKALFEIEKDIDKNNCKLLKILKQLKSTTGETDKEFKEMIKFFEKMTNREFKEKGEQVELEL